MVRRDNGWIAFTAIREFVDITIDRVSHCRQCKVRGAIDCHIAEDHAGQRFQKTSGLLCQRAGSVQGRFRIVTVMDAIVRESGYEHIHPRDETDIESEIIE